LQVTGSPKVNLPPLYNLNLTPGTLATRAGGQVPYCAILKNLA